MTHDPAGRTVDEKESFLAAVWNDPRSPRALTLALLGVACVFYGSIDLSRDDSPEFARGAILLGGLLLLPVAAFLFLKSREASVLLSRSGEARTTQGQVTELKKSFLTGAYVLTYRFQDDAGRAYQGKRALHQHDAFTWRVDDEGAVGFDPHDPAKSVWIGRGVEFEGNENTASQVASPSATRSIPVSLAVEGRPSTFALIRRSKFLRRAAPHGIYVLIGGLLWVLYAFFTDDSPADVTRAFMVSGLFVAFFLFWFVWNARAGAREVKDWRRLLSVGPGTRHGHPGRGEASVLGWLDMETRLGDLVPLHRSPRKIADGRERLSHSPGSRHLEKRRSVRRPVRSPAA